MKSSAKLTRDIGSQSYTEADLSNAFQLIARVTDESLLAHRGKAMPAFNRLSMLFTASAVRETIPLVKKSQSVPPSHKSITTSVSDLVKSLNQLQTEITEHLSLSEVDAVGGFSEQESEKPLDIIFVSSARSSKATFTKGLRYRRLALEYEKWELANFNSSRVTELIQNLDQDQTDRDGFVSRYINERLGEVEIKEVARKCLRHGIKMLVFERLCRNVVVSAVLSFTYTKFRALRFKELPQLKIMLCECPWIADISMKKDDWYRQCQEYYDGKSTQCSYFHR